MNSSTEGSKSFAIASEGLATMQFPSLATSSRSRSSSASPRPESRAVSNPQDRDLDISLRPPASPRSQAISFEGEDDLFGHKTAAPDRKRRESSPKQDGSPKFRTQSLFRSSRAATPEVAQSPSMLVADVQMPRSRLLISKSEPRHILRQMC